jgi:hypothetical protein
MGLTQLIVAVFKFTFSLLILYSLSGQLAYNFLAPVDVLSNIPELHE